MPQIAVTNQQLMQYYDQAMRMVNPAHVSAFIHHSRIMRWLDLNKSRIAAIQERKKKLEEQYLLLNDKGEPVMAAGGLPMTKPNRSLEEYKAKHDKMIQEQTVMDF